jgi:tetratricopeptide (TPR) repeat protein
MLAWDLSDWSGARDYHLRALAIAMELGRVEDICNTLSDLSLPTWVLGDHATARAYVERCVTQSRGIGYQSMLAHSLNLLAQMTQEMGEWAEARQYFQEALEICRSKAILWDMSSVLCNYGELLHLMGDDTSALQIIDESLPLSRAQTRPSNLAESYRLLAAIHSTLGNLDQSRHALREGLLIVRNLDIALWKTHTLITAIGLWPEFAGGERAAEWLGALLRIPDLPEQENRATQNLRERLEAELGPQRLTAAVERAQTLDQDQVIDSILVELDQPGRAGAIPEPRLAGAYPGAEGNSTPSGRPKR